MSSNSRAAEALKEAHRLCDVSSNCKDRKKASCDGAMSPRILAPLTPPEQLMSCESELPRATPLPDGDFQGDLVEHELP